MKGCKSSKSGGTKAHYDDNAKVVQTLKMYKLSVSKKSGYIAISLFSCIVLLLTM